MRRITVDRRLADDLIRVLICPLAEGVEEFFDRQDDWGRERAATVRPKTYVRKLGVPSPRALPWETLEEGQVFLSGEFEAIRPEGAGEEAEPRCFRVSRGRKEFVRIDDLEGFKNSSKQVYSHLLARR